MSETDLARARRAWLGKRITWAHEFPDGPVPSGIVEPVETVDLGEDAGGVYGPRLWVASGGYVPERKARLVDDVVLATSDDWQALYVNGQRVAEDHRIDVETVLEAIGVPFRAVEPTAEWVEEQERLEFPELLVDLPVED